MCHRILYKGTSALLSSVLLVRLAGTGLSAACKGERCSSSLGASTASACWVAAAGALGKATTALRK